MALSDFQVFNKWTYTTINELVAQQIDLFNAASNNTLILRAGSNTGDYTESTQWEFLSGLVRRRNAYGTGAVTAIDIQMLLDTMVKVAAGTPPVNINPGQFEWINMNQEEGALMIARQLAPQMMQDMLNTAVAALAAALQTVAAVNTDVSAGSGGAELMTPANLNTAMAKFGDRSGAIAAWVVHSKPMHDYFGNAITNAAQLYTYDTIAVVSDPFGKRFIMSDIPALVIAGTPNDYLTLGLVQGAAVVERNSDYTQNIETKNGDENITRTFQAEWSYNLGVKGFAWDKTNGGKSPNSAALATGTNWDKYATSNKDIAGVVLRTQ